MLTNKKNISTIIYCIILTAIIFVIFWPITKTFYQQDEWLGYGLYLAKGAGLIMQNTGSFWGIVFGQGRILTNLLMAFFYKFFPLNIYPIAFLAIFLHSVNALLVFSLAKKIFKNSLSAFFGSLFFGLNSVSQSAVTWSAASINTLPSTTLILISVYLFFKYLDDFKQKWLLMSFFAIYVSLFFKETGVFLFLLLPVTSLLFDKYTLKSYIKTFWFFFVAAGLIVGYRLLGFLFTPHEEALFLTGSSKYFFDSLVVRSVLYPLTSLSLSLVPPNLFLNFARYITNVNYPFIPEGQFILVAQTIVLDLLALLLSAIIVFFSLRLFKLSKPGVRKSMVFWFIFLLANFLPYIIISKSYSYLESRYYYLSAASWGMIFAWLFSLIFEKIKRLPTQLVFVLCFAYFIYIHVTVVSLDIKRLVGESQTRIQILNQITKLQPDLISNKNIFYITGNSDYLLPGNKAPFQQGFGHALMTIYFKSGKIPKDFLNESYLFEIGSQGYRESERYGFGYFSDKDTLKPYLNRKDISVIGLYYDSKENKIIKLDPFRLGP